MAVNMRKSGKNNSKNLNNKYQQPVDIMAVNMKKSVKNKNKTRTTKILTTCWHHGSEHEEAHAEKEENKNKKNINNKTTQPVGIMAVNMRKSIKKYEQQNKKQQNKQTCWHHGSEHEEEHTEEEHRCIVVHLRRLVAYCVDQDQET